MTDEHGHRIRHDGRRAEDLAPFQQHLLARAFITPSGLEIDGSTGSPRLRGLIDACQTLLPSCDLTVSHVAATGELSVLLATSEAARLADDWQIDTGKGPVFQAVRADQRFLDMDHRTVVSRWPELGSMFQAFGFQAIYVVLLQANARTIGSLNIYARQAIPLPLVRVEWLEALAEAAAGVLELSDAPRSDLDAVGAASDLEHRATVEVTNPGPISRASDSPAELG